MTHTELLTKLKRVLDDGKCLSDPFSLLRDCRKLLTLPEVNAVLSERQLQSELKQLELI